MTIRLHAKQLPLYAVLIGLTVLWLLPVVSSMLVALKSSKDFVSQTWADLPTSFYFFTNLATALPRSARATGLIRKSSALWRMASSA